MRLLKIYLSSLGMYNKEKFCINNRFLDKIKVEELRRIRGKTENFWKIIWIEIM